IYEFIAGVDGALYGTASGGGNANAGLVFRMTPNGVLTPLASFAPWGAATPYSGLYRGKDGTLYGTTYSGGTNGIGTVFTLATNGSIAIVSCDSVTGAHPSSPLLRGPDGALYGVANRGGPSDDGTVYRLTPNGKVALVASFNFSNGSSPWGPLCLGPD